MVDPMPQGGAGELPARQAESAMRRADCPEGRALSSERRAESAARRAHCPENRARGSGRRARSSVPEQKQKLSCTCDARATFLCLCKEKLAKKGAFPTLAWLVNTPGRMPALRAGPPLPGAFFDGTSMYRRKTTRSCASPFNRRLLQVLSGLRLPRQSVACGLVSSSHA